MPLPSPEELMGPVEQAGAEEEDDFEVLAEELAEALKGEDRKRRGDALRSLHTFFSARKAERNDDGA
jgi:hypothetical protein